LCKYAAYTDYTKLRISDERPKLQTKKCTHTLPEPVHETRGKKFVSPVQQLIGSSSTACRYLTLPYRVFGRINKYYRERPKFVSAAKFIANASHRSGQCSIILILKFLGQSGAEGN